jgi:hypothetical protein
LVAFDTDDCDPSTLGYPDLHTEVVSITDGRDGAAGIDGTVSPTSEANFTTGVVDVM